MARFILFLLLFNLLSAEVVYVKSKYAQLYKNPSKKLFRKRVKLGTKLQVVRTVSRWLQIKYQDQKFWVYKGKISKVIPRRDKSLLTKGYKNEVATGSAVRAFPYPVDHVTRLSHMIGNSKCKRYMLYQQSFIVTNNKKVKASKLDEVGIKVNVITSEDLESFLAYGKIGEYANFSENQ